MTEPQKITEIYLWICEEPDGGEGIPAVQTEIEGKEMVMPLLGADFVRVADMTDAAMSIYKQKGYPMKLVKFTNMEVLEKWS